jgi:hypothetical protein
MDDIFLPDETNGFDANPFKEDIKLPADSGRLAEDTPFTDVEFDESETGPAVPLDQNENKPHGLFTARGNIGWESYTMERLTSEIHRCASFEQDLFLLTAEFRGDGKISDALYRKFTDEAVAFFSMRDLIFEYGEKGITVIVPSADLEQGIAKAEEFRSRIIAKMPVSFENRTGLCIGLSSRSGRLIEAKRLMLESSTALKKAMADPVSPVIAFKSDPEKYREFLKGR